MTITVLVGVVLVLGGVGFGAGVAFPVGLVCGWAMFRASWDDAANYLIDSPVPFDVDPDAEVDPDSGVVEGDEWKHGRGSSPR